MKDLPGERRYPKEIVDANGDIWRVKFANKIPDFRGRDVLGLCDPSEQTISIRRGQTRRELFMTFFHELIHAAEDSGEFTLDHKYVDKLEEHLGGIILANWDAFRELFA